MRKLIICMVMVLVGGLGILVGMVLPDKEEITKHPETPVIITHKQVGPCSVCEERIEGEKWKETIYIYEDGVSVVKTSSKGNSIASSRKPLNIAEMKEMLARIQSADAGTKFENKNFEQISKEEAILLVENLIKNM